MIHLELNCTFISSMVTIFKQMFIYSNPEYAYVKLDGRDQIVIFAVLTQDVSMALVKKDLMEAKYLGLVNAMKVTGITILLLRLLLLRIRATQIYFPISHTYFICFLDP